MTTITTTATQPLPSPLTNIGPLSPFTQAPGCFDPVLVGLSTDYFDTTSMQIQVDYHHTDNQGNLCLRGFYGHDESPLFSPGTACPSGYGPSCTLVAAGATLGAATSLELWDALPSGDIAIGCCISGYTCAGSNSIYQCDSTLAKGDTITIIDNEADKTSKFSVDPYTSVTLYAARLIYMPEKPASSTHSNGLSQAQQVAVGLCVPLALIIFFIAGLFLYKHRKRKMSKPLDNDGESEDPEALGRRELDASGNIVCNHELDPTPISELPEDKNEILPQEIAELVGDSVVQLAPLNASPATIQRKPVGSSRPAVDGCASISEARKSQNLVSDFKETNIEEAT